MHTYTSSHGPPMKWDSFTFAAPGYFSQTAATARSTTCRRGGL